MRLRLRARADGVVVGTLLTVLALAAMLAAVAAVLYARSP